MTKQAPIILIYHTKSQTISPIHDLRTIFKQHETSIATKLKGHIHLSSSKIMIDKKEYHVDFHPYKEDIIVLLYEVDEWQQDPFYDPLTGVLNQHSFIDVTNQVIKNLQPGEKRVLIYLQLDQFNSIQDVLGYRSSEQVLSVTAERLKKKVGNRGIISHFAFGHFALFLPADEEGRLQDIQMEDVSEELNLPMVIHEQDVYMTHSIGVSIYPDHGHDAKMCIQMAKVALNAGKKTNARSVKTVFSKKMLHLLEDDLQVEMNLRKALDQQQFELYYQPQVDSETGKIVGFEGLIRWNHPDRGLIPPIEFIPLAESTGLILPMEEWVIEQAFSKLEKWKLNGKEDITLSINISPRHFLHQSIYTFFKECLHKFNVNPKLLIVEITESVAMEDFESVKNRISEIQTLGISVSIDDFGTGFSAFKYLQHFPIQEIKIDRQFIRDIVNNEKSMGIAKTIIDLAKLLKINVVSEGVETEEQWKILKKLGCPQLQGFYFAKPMPTSDLGEWFESYEKQTNATI